MDDVGGLGLGFSDAVLELARRTDLGDVIELAPTDEEAALVLEAMNEVDSEQAAGDIAARLRAGGHTL